MGPSSTDSDSCEIVSCSSSSSVTDTQPTLDRWPFGLIGGPDDRPFPTGKVYREISNLLGKVAQREFSFGDIAYLLPILPGLSVTNVGTVSLPLREEIADKLMATASEQYGKVWTVAPHQVKMKNTEWLNGLQTLCSISTERLGYKDTIMQPVLKKLQVIAPGGCRDEQIRLDRDNRSVATLLVQFPSEFTGGGLVVQREGKVGEIHYELGAENAMAAFRPHYVVSAAGSNCSMEQVTSGYCLMMEYSLCLPVDHPLGGRDRVSEKLQHELAEAVEKLKGGSEAFNPVPDGGDEDDSGVVMLLMPKSCTEEQIQTRGCKALMSADKERLQFLMDANNLLSPEKQLRFYIAKLRSDLKPSKNKSVADATWYSLSGAKVGYSNAVTMNLNVLNPDNETLSQLWETGDVDMSERFAIIMWAASADVTNRLDLIGIAAAIPVILEQSSIGMKTLQRLLKEHDLEYYEFARDLQVSNHSVLLLALCKKLVAAIVYVKDETLVGAFLKKYFDQLTNTEKIGALPWLSSLVDTFGWGAIGNSIIGAIDCQSPQISMDRALGLAESLIQAPYAQAELTLFAVKKAQLFCRAHPEKLAQSTSMSLLWKHAMACGLPKAFLKVRNLFVDDAKHLGPVVDTLSQHINATSSPLHSTTLVSLAWTRRQWLINEITDCQKPFPWQILNANFAHGTEILSFLQSSQSTLVLRTFPSLSSARFLVAVLQQNIKGPLDVTVGVGEDQEVFVQIKKTGGEFDPRRSKVPAYMAEILHFGRVLLRQPSENVSDENSQTLVNTIGKKRTLDDDTEVIIID